MALLDDIRMMKIILYPVAGVFQLALFPNWVGIVLCGALFGLAGLNLARLLRGSDGR